MNRPICIEGNIGIGKTTLVKKLAQHFSAPAFYEEFDENPWLPLFYKNPTDTALALELSFLTDRCKQLIQIEKQYSNNLFFSDYCLDKCLLFAQVNLSATDFEQYKKLYHTIALSLQQPQLVVVIHTSTNNLLSNIKQRNRSYEQGMQPVYLDKLNEAYKQFFTTEKSYCVLNIFTDTINEKVYASIFNEIVSFLQIKNPSKNISIQL